MQKIQAAIFDVDGTLFDYHEKKIHASTVTAIRALQERGVTIILASGRSYPLLGKECLAKIKADYYILSNGHNILDGQFREIFSKRFSFEQTEYVVALTRKYQNGLMLKYPLLNYLYNKPEEMFEVFNNIGLDRTAFVDCLTMNYHQKELPIGFTLRGSDEIKKALAARGDFRVELFHDESECDVFCPDVNKMIGLEVLAKSLKLNPAQCIAYGDSRNDLEMIRWAGLGVAMGNACQELKDAADSVCPASWADGIAISISHLLADIF
ncbi:MAG: HAD-IIB family hydrolase [Ruthenibacterium sp.]